MSQIFSDEISEVYRKYIIKIKLSDQQSFFLLWGTNLANEDMDYLMLDTHNNIIAFTKIKDMLKFLRQSDLTIDEQSTKRWAHEYRSNKAYVTYNIGAMLGMINDVEDFKTCDRELASAIINFRNLFSDYAYQVDRKDLLDIHDEVNLNIFIEWVNVSFFWDHPSEDHETEFEKQLVNLDFNKAKRKIKAMVDRFVETLTITGYPVWR